MDEKVTELAIHRHEKKSNIINCHDRQSKIITT